MRKIPLLFLILIASVLVAEGPRFKHKDTYQQQEFENVYQDIRGGNSKYVPYTDATKPVDIPQPLQVTGVGNIPVLYVSTGIPVNNCGYGQTLELPWVGIGTNESLCFDDYAYFQIGLGDHNGGALILSSGTATPTKNKGSRWSAGAAGYGHAGIETIIGANVEGYYAPFWYDPATGRSGPTQNLANYIQLFSADADVGVDKSTVALIVANNKNFYICDTHPTGSIRMGTSKRTDDLVINTNGGVTVGYSLEAKGQLIGMGTQTNDNASAGQIGEYIESNVTYANRVSAVTSNVDFTVTSVVLSSGDWDVSANYMVYAEGSSNVTAINAGFSGGSVVAGADGTYMDVALTAGKEYGVNVGPNRITIASGTSTINMKLYCTYTVANPTVWGRIRARRMR